MKSVRWQDQERKKCVLVCVPDSLMGTTHIYKYLCALSTPTRIVALSPSETTTYGLGRMYSHSRCTNAVHIYSVLYSHYYLSARFFLSFFVYSILFYSSVRLRTMPLRQLVRSRWRFDVRWHVRHRCHRNRRHNTHILIFIQFTLLNLCYLIRPKLVAWNGQIETKRTRMPPPNHRLINITEFTAYRTNDGCVQKKASERWNETKIMDWHRRRAWTLSVCEWMALAVERKHWTVDEMDAEKKT